MENSMIFFTLARETPKSTAAERSVMPSRRARRTFL